MEKWLNNYIDGNIQEPSIPKSNHILKINWIIKSTMALGTQKKLYLGSYLSY